MKFLALVVLLASQVLAAPYFRPLDYQHPKPVFGALIAPEALGQSEASSLLPLITHSPKDGCLLPTIVCEDWTPLAVGASMNAGKITLIVAPLANVVPWIQSAVQNATGKTYVKNPSVTISAGPALEYKQTTNKGYLRIFTGLALNF
jgi:hypothetical protein